MPQSQLRCTQSPTVGPQRKHAKEAQTSHISELQASECDDSGGLQGEIISFMRAICTVRKTFVLLGPYAFLQISLVAHYMKNKIGSSFERFNGYLRARNSKAARKKISHHLI